MHPQNMKGSPNMKYLLGMAWHGMATCLAWSHVAAVAGFCMSASHASLSSRHKGAEHLQPQGSLRRENTYLNGVQFICELLICMHSCPLN